MYANACDQRSVFICWHVHLSIFPDSNHLKTRINPITSSIVFCSCRNNYTGDIYPIRNQFNVCRSFMIGKLTGNFLSGKVLIVIMETSPLYNE